MEMAEIEEGKRYQMHPVTDLFMFGDRYGEVASKGSKYVYVRMERSGRLRSVLPGNLLPIDN